MDQVSSLAAGGRPVQRALLGNQIADALRREILLGVLKPGTRMAQQQLCERFGTSRMPVRDGLRVLAHEGLLITDAGQHTIVAPLSRGDLQDSFLIEGMLAGVAAERASKAASEDDLDRLDGLHHRMLEASDGRDQTLVADLNWDLHRTINRLSGSRKLIGALRVVSLDLPRNYLVQMPEWNERSNAEHAVVLEAMRRRQHETVNTLMVDHIVDSGKGLIAYLESQGLELD